MKSMVRRSGNLENFYENYRKALLFIKYTYP